MCSSLVGVTQGSLLRPSMACLGIAISLCDTAKCGAVDAKWAMCCSWFQIIEANGDVEWEDQL